MSSFEIVHKFTRSKIDDEFVFKTLLDLYYNNAILIKKILNSKNFNQHKPWRVAAYVGTCMEIIVNGGCQGTCMEIIVNGGCHGILFDSDSTNLVW